MQLRGSKLPRKGRCQPPHDVTPPPLRELKVGAERRSHYRAVTSPRLYRRWVVDFDYSPHTIKEACKILREELLKHEDLYRAFSASIYSALNEMLEETWIDEMPEIILSRIIGED